jgi:D-alanine-D-alanine ligase
MEKHVVVLAGGKSSERDISLQSGSNCTAVLRSLGYKVTEVDPDETLPIKLSALKPDVVFNALHGTYGEDGSIAGLLEVMNIPYTHSGVLASALCMNKGMVKEVVTVHGVMTPNWFKMSVQEILSGEEKDILPIKRPYVVKAISQGSTFGVYIVKEGDASFAQQIISNPWRYGSEAIVEQYISGAEISVAVLHDKALGVLELRPLSGFYDFEAKYTQGKTIHVYPAEIPQQASDKAMRFAEIAHKVAGCRTLSRSDFIYDPKRDEVFFLEINSHPGFTELSIVPEIAVYNGISFAQLLQILIDDAINTQHANGLDFDNYTMTA